METRALLVVVALLGLAGCQAFGEDASAPPTSVEAVREEAPPRRAPTETLDAPAASPAPAPTEPPAPGAQHLRGTLDSTVAAPMGASLTCTHVIKFKNVVVDVTVGPDGRPSAAKVTATAVENTTGTNVCGLILPGPTVHSYSFVGASALGDGRTRIALTPHPSAALVIEGRFDGQATDVDLHWQGMDYDERDDWRLDTIVRLANP